MSDPFPTPDTLETQKSDGSSPTASSADTPGLDVTGASISSVTGGDGRYMEVSTLTACQHRHLRMEANRVSLSKLPCTGC